MPEEHGLLIIAAERGGTTEELTSFLSDLQNAYIALYLLDKWSLDLHRLRRRVPLEFLLDAGYPFAQFGLPWTLPLDPQHIIPHDRLVVARIRIESPGFWEFVGSLNPLQQIREYLNDRHKRRQDREYREPSEKERLELENELLKLQIYEKQNTVLRERIEIMKELGYSNEEIERRLWSSVGEPLSRLGKHQDTHLIGGSHDKDKYAA